MGKRKPVPAAARAPKRRPKRERSGKQGDESPEENPKPSELDGGLAPTGDASSGSVLVAAEILGTKAGAVETGKHESKSNGSFQGIDHSDEDGYNPSSGDATGDIVNNGNACSDDMETSFSFYRHVSHIITNEEVNALMKQNCKFKWEMPAADIPKSKWVGTGEKMQVYPKIQDLDEGGLLLFVSSYFEYIRISNFLKSKEASFCQIGEATSQQDISRSRLWFFEGKKKILLYSERSHFYHWYKIRGTHHLLIYSLPGRKEFYPKLVNMLGESNNPKCNVLFSRLDLLKLERIVGTSAARRLIYSDKSMFVFC